MWSHCLKSWRLSENGKFRGKTDKNSNAFEVNICQKEGKIHTHINIYQKKKISICITIFASLD